MVTTRWQKCPSGCVRQLDKEWLLMNHRSKGWSSYAIPFPSIAELEDRMGVQILDRGQDEFGYYFNIAKNMSRWSA